MAFGDNTLASPPPAATPAKIRETGLHLYRRDDGTAYGTLDTVLIDSTGVAVANSARTYGPFEALDASGNALNAFPKAAAGTILSWTEGQARSGGMPS